MSEDVETLMIDRSKFMANGEKYFKMFEKHVPRNISGTILLLSIGNLDCMDGLMSLNKDAKYLIIDNSRIAKAANVLFSEEYNLETKGIGNEDLYNLIRDLDMKFDCIVMNPPYQKNLHLKILVEAIRHLTDDGVCVNLSPVHWLQNPIAKLMKNSDFNKYGDSIAKHIESLDIVTAAEASALFNAGFWNTIGIYICRTNDYVLYKDFAKMSEPELWPFVEKIGIPLFTKKLVNICRVYDMFSKNATLPYWIKCSRVHGHPGQKDEFDCITPKYELVFNKKGHEGREVYFKTKEEALSFFNTMNLKFYKFLKKLRCYPTGDFNKGLPWLGDAINPRTGLKGYEGEWTNEDLYQYFELTEDEIKTIEETMKKYTNEN